MKDHCNCWSPLGLVERMYLRHNIHRSRARLFLPNSQLDKRRVYKTLVRRLVSAMDTNAAQRHRPNKHNHMRVRSHVLRTHNNQRLAPDMRLTLQGEPHTDYSHIRLDIRHLQRRHW